MIFMRSGSISQEWPEWTLTWAPKVLPLFPKHPESSMVIRTLKATVTRIRVSNSMAGWNTDTKSIVVPLPVYLLSFYLCQ